MKCIHVTSEGEDFFSCFSKLSAQEGPSAWLLSQHKSNVIVQVCPLCFIAHASPCYPTSFCWCWELFILATKAFFGSILDIKVQTNHNDAQV